MVECLWDPTHEVTKIGEVCSYDCYNLWIAHRIWMATEEILIMEDDEVVIIPLEEQPFHKKVWDLLYDD